jgi:hypothetical protein
VQEIRLLTLIEGVLAANIFDWGARACVDLYHKGTIIEIYRMSRNKMQRPWRVIGAKSHVQHTWFAISIDLSLTKISCYHDLGG